MVLIKVYPKNKKDFIKLKTFCKEIIDICKELKITPLVWGGLAYFGYTQQKKYVIHDIDFLVPDNSIKKVIKILKERRIKYKYISDWHLLVISKGNLKIELDPIEWYYKGHKKFKEFNFDGLIVRIVELKSLIKIYEKASKVSKDKPEQHYKRFMELKRLK